MRHAAPRAPSDRCAASAVSRGPQVPRRWAACTQHAGHAGRGGELVNAARRHDKGCQHSCILAGHLGCRISKMGKGKVPCSAASRGARGRQARPFVRRQSRVIILRLISRAPAGEAEAAAARAADAEARADAAQALAARLEDDLLAAQIAGGAAGEGGPPGGASAADASGLSAVLGGDGAGARFLGGSIGARNILAACAGCAARACSEPCPSVARACVGRGRRACGWRGGGRRRGRRRAHDAGRAGGAARPPARARCAARGGRRAGAPGTPGFLAQLHMGHGAAGQQGIQPCETRASGLCLGADLALHCTAAQWRP